MSTELDIAFEDAGGLSSAGYQKQAPVRFGSSPVSQGLETIMSLAALGVSGAQWRNTAQFALTMLLGSLSDSEAKVNSPVQLLAGTVDTLVEVNEDQFLASLTDADYQRLVTSLDKLIDVVGEDKNHFCVPLIDFIVNLVKEREEEFSMLIRKQHRPARRSRGSGRTSPRPHFRLVDLLGKETEEAKHDQITNTPLKPRRPEKVGRPAKRIRAKMANRFPRETDDDAYGEVDTGAPVGNEVW